MTCGVDGSGYFMDVGGGSWWGKNKGRMKPGGYHDKKRHVPGR